MVSSNPSVPLNSGSNDESASISMLALVKKLWVLVPILFALGLGGSLMSPVIPAIKNQFFVGPAAWNATKSCTLTVSDGVLQKYVDDCTNGQNDVATLNGVQGAIKAGVTFFLWPVLGKFSDCHGRKPIVSGSLFIMTASAASLYLCEITGLSVVVWIVVDTISAFAPFLPVILSILADCTSSKERPAAFSVALGLLFFFQILGPVLYTAALSHLDDSIVILITTIVFGVVTIYSIFLFRETLPTPDEERQTYEFKVGDLVPTKALAVLNKNTSMRQLIGVYILSTLGNIGMSIVGPMVGVNDLKFNKSEVAEVMIIASVCSVVVQVLVTPLLLRFFSERTAIMMACFVSASVFILQPMYFNKTIYYIVVVVASLGGVMQSVPSVMMSKRVSPHIQGQLDSATGAVSSVTLAITNLLFETLLYRLNHRLPYFFGAGFLILCGILARTIREQSDEELAAMVAAEEAEAHGKAGLADVTSSADYQHLTESPDSNGRL